MSREGELRAANDEKLFLAGDYVSGGGDEAIVHPDVQSHAGALEVLKRLGVVALEPLEELKRMGAAIDRGTVDWDRFWGLVRETGPDRPELRTLLREVYRYGLRLRNEAGDFRPYYELLLPGAIAHAGEDVSVAMDVRYHRLELTLIEFATGISDGPVTSVDIRQEAWYRDFESVAEREYRRDLPPSSPQPRTGYVKFVNGVPKEGACRLGPLLGGASPDFKARFTVSALSVAAADRGWLVGHGTDRRYPEILSQPPAQWGLRCYGYLPSSFGPAPIAECVAGALEDWPDLLPVADRTESFLGLPERIDELSAEAVEAASERALRVDDAVQLGSFYGAAAAALRADGGPAFQAPAVIRCHSRDGFENVSPRGATVAPDRPTLELVCASGASALLCTNADHADALVKRWGLRPSGEVEKLPVEWIASGDPTPLRELYPGLPVAVLDGRRLN